MYEAFSISRSGEPVVQTLGEYLRFPSERLNSSSPFAPFFPTLVPVIAVTAYLVGQPLLASFVKRSGMNTHAAWIKHLAVAHDIALAVYSAWTCYNAWAILFQHVQQDGLMDTYCDKGGRLWKDLEFWAVHFYISKYWEFLDTILLILKGKKVMFLQTYHHAGVVLTMWAMCASAEATVFVVVGLNSFIHTIMYTYYAFAALGYSWPLKNVLTQAQLVQFFVGIAMTVPAHIIEGCSNSAQRFALAFIQLYAVGLIPLFLAFYVEAYLKKRKQKADAAAAAKAVKQD